jgi:hypothetical protein
VASYVFNITFEDDDMMLCWYVCVSMCKYV